MSAKSATREQPRQHDVDKQRMPEAHSLEEAVNSDNSLEGYVAINHSPGPHGEVQADNEEIAKVAYQLYLERGGGHGSHEEDWLRAEREVRARRNGAIHE
jgi:hypothetical protein